MPDNDAAEQKLNAEKRAAVTAALSRGLIQLTVNANARGVRVPEHWNTASALPLNISYRFRAVEVIIDDEKIGATLSFNGVPFRCVLPWPSIWSLKENGAVQFWGVSMPEQAVEEMKLRERALAPKGKHLRLVQ